MQIEDLNQTLESEKNTVINKEYNSIKIIHKISPIEKLWFWKYKPIKKFNGLNEINNRVKSKTSSTFYELHISLL